MTKTNTAAAAPRQRNAHVTRERILAVAYKEFAARGYDGARIDTIVAKCRISKNLLYHYFEGKEALFIEVMERAYKAMRDRQNELALPGKDPRDDMKALIVHTIQHFIDEPEFMLLLSTENVHKAAHIKKSKAIPEMFNPLKSALNSILETGKRTGVFRKDADWLDLYVSISGLGSYFITNRYTLSYVLGEDIGSQERIKRRLEHAPDMVLSYLCNLADENR